MTDVSTRTPLHANTKGPRVVLSLDRVTYRYSRTTDVIRDRSESFHGGEVVAITGPSGSGKSTLLYVLGLLTRPSCGQVLVNSLPTSHLSDSKRAEMRGRMFGFVFQDSALDASRSVLDNVIETALYTGMARASAVERAYELLTQFGVEIRAMHKPGQVSGGQAQRIALARAMLNRPSFLLADEPTGNLDERSAAIVINSLRACALEGAVVLIATHDIKVIGSCDRVVNVA